MIKRVNSAANPTIKMMRSLDRKKIRTETGLFLAEGARLAIEAADLDIFPEILIFSSQALQRPHVENLVQRAEQAGVACIETSEQIIESVTKRDNSQNVVGAYRQHWSLLSNITLEDNHCWIVLQAIRDPGNLGTIMRTADSVGAKGIILLDDSCDPFSVEAVRASMGSIFTTKITRCSFDDFDHWRQKKSIFMVGTSLLAKDYHYAISYRRPVFLLMGNEQSGLPDEMARTCDALVKIPMIGKADSLNLAIATSVMLYEIWRQADYL